MSGHAVAIATGGIVFCRKQLIRKNVIPIKYTLVSKSINFNLDRNIREIQYTLTKQNTSYEMKKHDVLLEKKYKNILYKKS